MSAYAEMRDSVNLDQVIVTGTRTPKTLKNTPIQTRLISAQDIARLDATTVQDLLTQELPGVEFEGALCAPEDVTKASERSFSGANWL